MIDNGVGIAPPMMKHMFELFHSTKGNRGTGLGLAVAKKIVDEHEGSITRQEHARTRARPSRSACPSTTTASATRRARTGRRDSSHGGRTSVACYESRFGVVPEVGINESGTQMLEKLESRLLLSAVFYDENSTSIRIRGTQGPDDIRITRRGDRVLVELNDRRRWFAVDQVKWIEVLGYDGDDVINAEHSPFALHAHGDGGRDTIVGGWGNDHLHGIDGSDRLIGNEGNDVLDGGGGRDLLSGGGGQDTLDGMGGDDHLWGHGGQDYLVSRIGDDMLDGGEDGDTAVTFPGRGELLSIEGLTIVNPEKHDDPYTHLSAVQRKDGKIAVTITATHSAGGWERMLGELSRNHRTYNAFVRGIDHAGPGGVRAGSGNLPPDTHPGQAGGRHLHLQRRKRSTIARHAQDSGER